MIDIVHGDFRQWELRPSSLDLVVFDPPWDNDHIPLYRDAGIWAERHLVEGGVLLAYAGQNIPKTTALLSESGLHWYTMLTIAHGDRNPSLRFQYHTFDLCRYVGMWVKGQGPTRYTGRYLYTLLNSHGKEKNAHRWQQGLAPLMYWMRSILLGRVDATVADITLGGGTTGVAAKMLGHSFVGCDVDEEAIAVARIRIEETRYDLGYAEKLARSVIPRRRKKRRLENLLVRGNAKVGEDVYVWNLPVFETCPGSSSVCRAVCYGDRGHFRWPQNRALNRRKLKIADSDQFVDRMKAELTNRGVRLLRWHSVGDFHSIAYIRRWVEILRARPEVTAWGYTRSWRVPKLLPELEVLASLPNVRLWFSADAETGLPPRVPGVQVSYLQVNDETLADPEGKIKLAWRTRQKGRQPAKRLALPMAPPGPGALICPNYQGLGSGSGHDITCQQCRVCFE